MRKEKKGILNFSFSLFYKMATVVVGIILPKLFITTFGSEINGLQASVNQIFTYIALLESGIGGATIQSLFRPVAQNDHHTSNAYLSATTHYYNKIGCLYMAVLVGLSLIYPLVVSVKGLSYWAVVLFIILSGAMSGINFFYLAKIKLLISAAGDEYITSVISMLIFLASSTCKISLIMAGANVLLVQFAVLVINLIFTFVYYYIVRRKYPWLNFKEKPDFSCMNQKNNVMVHQITSLIFQNIDIILLTFLCDLNVVSIYTMYKLVVNMITTIVATFGDSFNFVFGQAFNTEEQDGKPRFCRIIDTFNVFYSAIAFALFSTMFIMILPFMKLYTNNMDINYIFPILPFLYLTIEVLTVGREAMLRTITVAGHFKKTQWRAITEAVINLTVSIFAIIVFKYYFGDIGGLYGALIGTIVSMLYRTIDINIYANKKILSRSCFKTFKVFLVNLTLFGFVIFIKQFIDFSINSYFEFFANGVIIAVIFLSVFIFVQSIANIKETKFILGYILNYKKKKRN